MVFYKEGDKIECQHSEIIAKQITSSVIQRHPKIGLLRKYKCKRDGSVVITKELEPKKALIDKYSNLNQGDKLNSNKFYFIVKNVKKVKLQKIGGHTARHSSQKINTKNYTFAEIEKPFTHIQNALENKKELG